jgi:hypothetical protein
MRAAIAAELTLEAYQQRESSEVKLPARPSRNAATSE